MFNFSQYNTEFNECIAKGICSMLPGISALQEVLHIILRQISYYLLKLKMIGDDTTNEDKIFITLISAGILGNAYSDDQILRLVNSAYTNLTKIRLKYLNKCKEFEIEKRDVKNLIIINPQMNLSDIIALGEKAFHQRYKKFTDERKNFIELLYLIIKSVAGNLVQLFNYQNHNETFILEILEGMNLMNRSNVSNNKYKLTISNLVNIDKEILDKLYHSREKIYGEINKINVNYSTNKGKAILVSGNCLEDLKKLLDTIVNENINIDIYTHDDLLNAHIYKGFSKYAQLKGQFGICQENCVLDFATFPGAIFLTRNSKINTDYLYRGRLFTTSEIVPHGVQKLENNDFHALIDSALKSKGFAKGQTRPEATVGYNENEIINEFNSISEKIDKNEIEKIIILFSPQRFNENYENITKKLNSKTFILNFSTENFTATNQLKLNLGNNRYLIFKILKIFFEYININKENIEIYFSKCEAASISSMIYLKEQGYKKIYITSCSPNEIKPTLKTFIQNEYQIN